jgi:NADPH-dependent curcumin reductase CurA
MSASTNQQILFKSRPEGMPSEDNFEMVETPLPAIGEGEMLRRTIWLSVDPYMRGRMSLQKSYVPPANLGEPMVGQTVSEVLESKDPKFKPGDFVLGQDGWQAHAVGTGKGLRKLDPTQAPLSWSLGVLGMVGLTAYVAVLDIGQPKEGETLVVSAAAGAVGSIAGQIAKIKGCYVVGTASTDEKCTFVKEELGFDECVNYKKGEIKETIAAACPKGIDIYIDNVGGPILESVLRRINVHARIALVGLISQYHDTRIQPGPNLGSILVNRATMRGMIIFDHFDRMSDFQRDMAGWIREGKIKYQEDIVTGLRNTPRAFLGLFEGANTGKRVVLVSPDPTRKDPPAV